ncbi:MAG: hypothetical protein ACPGXK_08020 [Phycisphaerae bacterium]
MLTYLRFLLIVGVACLSGCATLGPTSLPGDRFSYNKSLAQSANEQLLLNIVRARYGEPLHWLEVNNMVSQYSFSANADISNWWNDLNVWPSALLRAIGNVDGDPSEQTTVEAGISYSDRPTISYTPIQGQDFAQRLLNPIPTSILLYFVQAGWPIDQVLSCCVDRLNHLANKGNQYGLTGFQRAVAILRKQQDEGYLHAPISGATGQGDFYITREHPEDPRERESLSRLLGLDPEAQKIRVTVHPRTGDDQLAVQTRSLLATMQALSECVELPQDDSEIEITEVAPDDKDFVPEKTWLRIKCSRTPRVDAFVQVYHRGFWFCIADSDRRSKRTFSLLTYLYSLQAADSNVQRPLLTIPTS